MKQPERLIHAGSLGARALLASLDEDVPPDLARGQEQTLRALGLATSPSADVHERPSVAARRAMPLASVAGLSLLCLLVFAISDDRGAATTKAAPTLAVEGEPATMNAITTTATPDRPAREAPSEVEPRGVDVHALASAPPEGRVDTKTARPTSGGARHAPESPTAPSTTVAPPPAREVTDELQLLERAQAAATRGRRDEALSLVALHRRDFPQGRFSVEMSVVEIETLAASGLVEQAAAQGERFLESHPGTPYTRRVEAVVRLRDSKEQSR